MKKQSLPKPPPLPALSLVGSTRFTYAFSRFLIIVFLLLIVGILFVPWRQNVIGNGKVVAFDPLDRFMNVESQLAGRIKVLNIVEGQVVTKGQVIAEIEDNDPLLLERLQSQKKLLESRKQFAEGKVLQIEAQEIQIELAKTNAINAAQEAVNIAQSEVKTIDLEQKRTTELYQKGLSSRRDYEQIILKVETSGAKLKSAESLLSKALAEYGSLLASIRGQREAASGEVETTQKEIIDLEVKINQTERLVITAPRDGVVYKIQATAGTYLSPGEKICSIIPQTDSRYVEIWLDGNDIALIKARAEIDGEVIPGSEVRLSFEGWPSIQAMGWPQLAVGTFGGEVVFIDTASDGNGTFRVLVGPAEDAVNRYNGAGEVKVGWPDKERWLRQGTLTQAWFLLEEVSLWEEVWRQINGFPPLIKDSAESLDPTID